MDENNHRKVTVITGGFFGDEGKGKIVSYLAMKDNPKIIARAGVGPNAGHTVYKEGRKYGLRMIPCGFVNPRARLLIGTGVLVNPQRFLEEVELTQARGRLFLDKRCGIIEDKHRQLDVKDDFLKKTIGTTGSGCGPANAERANRTLKLAQDIPELKDYLTDVPLEVNLAIDQGHEVLVEASQGFGLSLFYGSYPQVTSKDTSASMALTDIGLGPTRVKDVMVIYKAYLTRVGEGDMRGRITQDNVDKFPVWKALLDKAREKGIEGTVNEAIATYLGEKGTVTQRPRRVANFDFTLAKYSSMVNGATQLAITCLDLLYPDAAGLKEYEELPADARKFLEEIEQQLKIKITLVSTGPGIYDTIDLRDK